MHLGSQSQKPRFKRSTATCGRGSGVHCWDILSIRVGSSVGCSAPGPGPRLMGREPPAPPPPSSLPGGPAALMWLSLGRATGPAGLWGLSMEACGARPVSQAKGGPSGPRYKHEKCPTGLPKPGEGRAQDPDHQRLLVSAAGPPQPCAAEGETEPRLPGGSCCSGLHCRGKQSFSLWERSPIPFPSGSSKTR